MSKWGSILNSLEANKQETKLFKKFLRNPNGKLFLQVANSLASKGYKGEAIEMLSEGCTRYPNNHTAAIRLAEFYFERGLFTHCRNTLARHQIVLDRNTKGAKIWFFLSVLFDDFSTSIQTLEGFFQAGVLDEQALQVGETLRRKGPHGAKELLIDILLRMGVDFDPRSLTNVKASKPTANPQGASNSFEKISVEPVKENQFFVLPINEILFPGGSFEEELDSKRQGSSSSFLDSQTMAEIYEDQGQWEQSLHIYHRLLLKRPHNEQYRQKVAKLQDKILSEKSIYPKVEDNGLSSVMHSREIIDQQITKVSELIQILESKK